MAGQVTNIHHMDGDLKKCTQPGKRQLLKWHLLGRRTQSQAAWVPALCCSCAERQAVVLRHPLVGMDEGRDGMQQQQLPMRM